MKSTELRMGNIVDLHGQEDYRVIGLEKNYISVRYKNHTDSGDGSNLLPVPLTEELLLKAGFKKAESIFSEDEYGWKCFRLKKVSFINLYLEIRIENVLYLQADMYHDGEFEVIRELKYFHELQNLYFALTGKELEI